MGLSVVGSHFTFYEFDERGDRVATVAVELPFSNPLTHDFSLTEHYYIVAENPVRYEPDVAGALDGSQPALGPSFVASETGRSGLLALVPRDGSEPIVLDAGDASIVFHYANAWEEGSHIKVAACAFDRYELGAELCGNQISGAPRHRRDIVAVAASARWRGGTRRSTQVP